VISSATSGLVDYLRVYALERSISAEYHAVCERAVRHLEHHAGRPLHLHDLSDELLNDWAAAMRGGGLELKTVRNKLACLTALWRHAWDGHRVPDRPERVAKIRPPDPVPVAWTIDEFQRLAAAAREVPHWFERTGIRRSFFWEAIVWTFFDSGLRCYDVLHLRRSQFTDQAQAALVQHKSGRYHVVRVREETLALIDRLGPFEDPESRGGIVFWWAAGPKTFYAQFATLLRRAGLSNEKGITRRLRRTSATAFASVEPSRVWEHLGHAAPGLDRRNYVDRSILPATRPLPPCG